MCVYAALLKRFIKAKEEAQDELALGVVVQGLSNTNHEEESRDSLMDRCKERTQQAISKAINDEFERQMSDKDRCQAILTAAMGGAAHAGIRFCQEFPHGHDLYVRDDTIDSNVGDLSDQLTTMSIDTAGIGDLMIGLQNLTMLEDEDKMKQG